MRFHLPARLIVGIGLATSLGCATTVVKPARDGPLDCGIRYYRPKPYLLIQPPDGALTEQFVTLKLMWMPDFGEDFSIHIRSGIGTNTTSVTLKDGWELTELNSNTDTKTAAFLDSLSSLIGTTPKLLGGLSGGGLGGAEGGAMKEATNIPACQVRAHKVPLGFYEAVINPGPDGKKRLYGWRYVGFSPYANCPIDAAGATQQPCETADLFGLITLNGEMHFVRLSELEQVKTTILLDKDMSKTKPKSK